MFIRLTNTTKYEWDNFIYRYIPNKMRNFLSLNLSEEALSSLDVYIKETLKINATSKEILETALDNIIVTRDVQDYIIMLNTNILFLDTDYRVVDLVNLITYGNLEVHGYDIIIRMINYIRGNIDMLFTEYLNEEEVG